MDKPSKPIVVAAANQCFHDLTMLTTKKTTHIQLKFIEELEKKSSMETDGLELDNRVKGKSLAAKMVKNLCPTVEKVTKSNMSTHLNVNSRQTISGIIILPREVFFLMFY